MTAATTDRDDGPGWLAVAIVAGVMVVVTLGFAVVTVVALDRGVTVHIRAAQLR